MFRLHEKGKLTRHIHLYRWALLKKISHSSSSYVLVCRFSHQAFSFAFNCDTNTEFRQGKYDRYLLTNDELTVWYQDSLPAVAEWIESVKTNTTKHGSGFLTIPTDFHLRAVLITVWKTPSFQTFCKSNKRYCRIRWINILKACNFLRDSGDLPLTVLSNTESRNWFKNTRTFQLVLQATLQDIQIKCNIFLVTLTGISEAKKKWPCYLIYN